MEKMKEIRDERDAENQWKGDISVYQKVDTVSWPSL
jgi:hypothetical protein